MTARGPNEAQEKNPWYVLSDLIAGIETPVTVKYLLERILRYINTGKGVAWPSQKTLAEEMGVSLSTVERTVAEAKRLGVLGVGLVRTGKGKTDQFNQYWLDLARLKQLQQRPKINYQATVMGDGCSTELPSNDARATRTGAGVCLEVKHDAADGALVDGVPVACERVHVVGAKNRRRRKPGRKNRGDHDDDAFSRARTTDPPKPKTQHPPEHLAFARMRTLDRSNGKVRNPHAYVEKSLPEFFANFPAEIDEYLLECAIKKLGAALEAAKQKFFDPRRVHIEAQEVCEIKRALFSEAEKYRLPCNSNTTERAFNDAAKLLRLVPQPPCPASRA